MVDAAAPTARISILTASIKIALRQSLAGLVHDHESVGAPISFPGVIPLGVFNTGHSEPSCPTSGSLALAPTPPPSIPPLKGEGGAGTAAPCRQSKLPPPEAL